MARNRIANRKVQCAAEKLVEYLGHDEFHNYCELLMNEESGRSHIWLSVKILRDWLDIPPSEHEAENIADARAYRKSSLAA